MNTVTDRDQKWSSVIRRVRDLRRGHGGVILVDGVPGIGRSRLIEEAVAEAERREIAICTARADELSRWTPLSLIASALGVTAWTPTSPQALSGLLLGEIEQRVRRGPLLIALDDVQWADEITLAAVQSFVAHLRTSPVVWLLAARDGDGKALRLFDRLTEAGATRLRLDPLADDQVGKLLEETFGAAPGDDLANLAAGAGGNPALLTELLAGLREEHAVQVDATAGLVTDRLPKRLTALVRRLLAGFSADTVGVLEVAAVLGRECHAADVAEVLGRTAADIARAVREVLRAGILIGDELLTFQHELVWRAMTQTIAPSMLSALHRQVGLWLLHRGEDAAVEHLMHGALPGDTQAVRALAVAAGRSLGSAPATAAAIAAKALTLTSADDPEVGELVVTRATALLRAGRMGDAAEAIALAGPGHAARLHDVSAAIAVLTGRTEHEMADEDWERGDLAASLDHAREAAAGPLPLLAVTHPGLALAVRLARIGDAAQAESVLADVTLWIEQTGHVPFALAAQVAKSWIALHAGRLGQAATEAQTALDTGRKLGITVWHQQARTVLSTVAFHRGDLAEAENLACTPWPQLRLASARLEPGDVAALVKGKLPDMADPAASSWLARTAMAAGDMDLAREAVVRSADLAERNPGLAMLAVAATHARGLVDRDTEALTEAMETHVHPWSRASAAEDLAVVLAGGNARSADAVRALDIALAGYQAVGAIRDVARVRSRLRAAGVRRRHWTYADRPVSGWASLTDTERDVVELVAEGLTNRQVAARMFVSPHTVHAHLGRIFRKLGVSSRVELTGLRHRVA
jgi:DNA-binding CsgD family transcriptional regulator